MIKRKFKALPLTVLRKRAFALKPLWQKNKLCDEEIEEFCGILFELVFRTKKPERTKKNYREKLSSKGI